MEQENRRVFQKKNVVAAILSALREEFESFAATSRKTRSTGNDAQTKSEGKYDTRSTEENYLADGQAKQAQAAGLALTAIGALPGGIFPEDRPLHWGALVELEFTTEKIWFFLAPAAGGLEVIVDGVPVTVLTLESPLGAQLKGKMLGESTVRPAGKIVRVL